MPVPVPVPSELKKEVFVGCVGVCWVNAFFLSVFLEMRQKIDRFIQCQWSENRLNIDGHRYGPRIVGCPLHNAKRTRSRYTN